ncbi:MAG: PIG-L family deacetylase [Proteobacteria bacterium]|nr:PIG-L family deacetylase [Pseudomonadota bacterium]
MRSGCGRISLRTMVIAPHPDDELLGCGGTLLRRKAEGTELAWLIVTGISEAAGYSAEAVAARDAEIAQVAARVGFDQVFNLRLATARLDELPRADLVRRFSSAFEAFAPTEVLVPHPSDVHTDHRLVFETAAACTKWFRYPSVTRVLAYETLSETEFGLDADSYFRPNFYVDISRYLEAKLEALTIYRSELGQFPFPRSAEAVRALASLRGATAGFRAAEAFQLLRERH